MINLRSGQIRPPAKANSALLRCLDSGLRPLDDQAALELSQSAHDVHNQASARTRGVDRVGQAAEVDFACAEFGDERDQMREGPPKPVQFPDDEGVARAEGSKGCIETAARGNAAAYTLVREDAPASSSPEGVTLQGEVLVDGRDAGVAD
jgi:hypothetical protein